jgi:hypothetical protein
MIPNSRVYSHTTSDSLITTILYSSFHLIQKTDSSICPHINTLTSRVPLSLYFRIVEDGGQRGQRIAPIKERDPEFSRRLASQQID